MVDLYINNQKVDLDSSVTIALSYQVTDNSDPTAIKNSFSKTVTLLGTDNNNDIFGHAYQLGRDLIEDDASYRGVRFDMRKRVPFVLYDNGNVIEKGYVKVDDITKNGNIIKYNITLYGGLGSFFYNLSYNENEDESELSLADLYYGFLEDDGSPMSKSKERKATLFQWNKDFINKSWDALGHVTYKCKQCGLEVTKIGGSKCPVCHAIDSFETVESPQMEDMHPENWITAAPTLSGYHDDFDNDKVLVKIDSSTNSFFPATLTNDGKTYRGKGGYGLVELPRELVEQEVKDLRSMYQRPAIRTKLILDAIANPENNGGFEVAYPDMTEGDDLWAYFNKSYILLNQLDFDDTQVNEATNLFLSEELVMKEDAYPGTTHVGNGVYLGTSDGITIDMSDYTNPTVEVNLQFKFTFNENIDKDKLWMCSRQEQHIIVNHTAAPKNAGNVVSGILCWLEAYDATTNKKIGRSAYKIMTTNYADGRDAWESIPFGGKYPDFYDFYKINDLDGDEDIEIFASDLNKVTDKTFAFDDYLNLKVSLDKVDNIKVRVCTKYVGSTQTGTRLDDNYDFIVENQWRNYIMFNKKEVFSNPIYQHSLNIGLIADDSNVSGYYDGIVSPQVQKMNVTKDVLFGNKISPFEFLTNFTKIFNLRYRLDEAIPKIYIERRGDYYINILNNIDDKIDRSQDIIINPVLSEYHWHEYGLPTPESYAQYLYSLKSRIEYGWKKYNTQYNFNADTNTVLEDNKFTSVLPYRIKSSYFNTTSNIPNIAWNDYTYTLWNDDGEYSKVFTSTASNKRYYSDVFLCCHDKDNNSVDDLDFSLVFFNGFSNNNITPYRLTDNMQMMFDLNDNPCYLYSAVDYGYTSMDDADNNRGEKQIQITRYTIPQFTKYFDSYSLDFTCPQFKVEGDVKIPDYNALKYIYDVFWKNYTEDLYSKNKKSVECYVFLDGKPQDLMREFYYFDNQIWIINKITDYDPNSIKPTKVEFVRVNQIANYTPKVPVKERRKAKIS